MIKKKLILNPLFLSVLFHIIVISTFITFYSIKSKQKRGETRITNISIEGAPTKTIGKYDLNRQKSSKTIQSHHASDSGLKTEVRNNTIMDQGTRTGQNGGTDIGITDNYIGSILRKIHHNKNYPSQARRMKLEGTTTISFILKNNGNLEKTLIKKTSGYKLLDNSAISTISKSAPYPPFPKGINAKQLELDVEIEFVL